MKNFKSAGKHSTYTQLAEKLARELMKSGHVNRISPGEISAKRAKSQRISVRRDGVSTLTITVVGGGIQKLFVMCDKKKEDSVDDAAAFIKKWALHDKCSFSYRDTTSE